MTCTKTCINVYSEFNPWIDFCIVFEDERKIKIANEIINQAYSEWFSAENNADETIADYISRRLTEVCLEHDIYFKDQEEENE